MKKVILGIFMLTSLVLSTSCEGDDEDRNNSASNQLKVTIDNQVVTFDAISVEKETFTYDNGEQFTVLNIVATIETDASQIIYFETEVGDLESFSLYAFEYLVDDEHFYDSGAFNTFVSVNDGSRLTATFSGTLVAGGQQSVTFENGTIDVMY